MTFAWQRQGVVHRKQHRRNRVQIGTTLHPLDRHEIERAIPRTAGCENSTIFASAAINYFGSLDRERQLQLLIQADIRRDRNHKKNVQVVAWIAENFRRWDFALYTQGVVAGTALLAFARLTPEERAKWVIGVHRGPCGGGT
jgi:hypothetical protein